MPSLTPERNFQASIAKSEKQLLGISELFAGIGQSKEAIKEKQADFLKGLYRKQINAVLAIFGLLRNANQARKAAKSKEKDMVMPDKALGAIAETSNLDPRPIAEAFSLIDEGDAILKLGAMMDDIYLNCSQIGERLGIEFTEKKRGVA